MSAGPSPSVMSEEVARFDALGDAWWDADGPMAPLHRLNPIRIGWARDLIVRHFKLEAQAARRSPASAFSTSAAAPACSPSRWRGSARMSSASIRRPPRSRPPAAMPRRPARGSPIAPRRSRSWRGGAALRRGERDGGDRARGRSESLRRRRRLARQARRPFPRLDPQPHLRSFALAIVGAEYVLRWLEPGTHRWEQFVTPIELTGFARAADLRRDEPARDGLRSVRRDWRLSSDTGVNYLFAARKPEG